MRGIRSDNKQIKSDGADRTGEVSDSGGDGDDGTAARRGHTQSMGTDWSREPVTD